MFGDGLKEDLPYLLEDLVVTTNPEHPKLLDGDGYNLGRYGAMVMDDGKPLILINTGIARTKRAIEETFSHELHHAYYELFFHDESYHNELNVEGEALDFLENNRHLLLDSMREFEELWDEYQDSL